MPITLDGTTGVTSPGYGAVSGTTGTFSGNVTANGLSTELRPLVLGTVQNSTSGTFIDFTGIPSWARLVTVMLRDVSTNGGQTPFIQLGTSSGPQTTGYDSRTVFIQASSVGTVAATTSGFPFTPLSAAAVRSGFVMFSNITGNTWVASGNVAVHANMVEMLSGGVALSGTLDRIRIAAGTTDTFDAGSINIMYE